MFLTFWPYVLIWFVLIKKNVYYNTEFLNLLFYTTRYFHIVFMKINPLSAQSESDSMLVRASPSGFDPLSLLNFNHWLFRFRTCVFMWYIYTTYCGT